MEPAVRYERMGATSAENNDFLHHVRDGDLVFLLVERNSVSVLNGVAVERPADSNLLLHDEASEDRRSFEDALERMVSKEARQTEAEAQIRAGETRASGKRASARPH